MSEPICSYCGYAMSKHPHVGVQDCPQKPKSAPAEPQPDARKGFHKLVEETETDCRCGNYSMSTVSELLTAAEQRATRAARLEEAEWWEHLAPDCGMPPSGNPNCIYCQRLAELRAALSAPELKVTVSSSGMPGVAPPSWTEGSAPAQTPSEEERKWK